MKKLAAVDYETFGIESRPMYPPEPVGVAIQVMNKAAEYLAWGHPSGNNCTKREGVRYVRHIQEEYIPLYHNAAFDIDVARVHCGIPIPEAFEDTLILAYLRNPREESLSLKPMSEKYLDMPPDEQSRLKDWVVANVPEAAKKPSTWGAYIALAPASIVSPYAKGDVRRTMKLFRFLIQDIKDRGMFEWYQKEKLVIIPKLAMEERGIRVDVKKLQRDIPRWEKAHKELDVEIRKKLKITKSWEQENCKNGVFNTSSGPQLAAAMKRAGKVGSFIQTKKGRDSTKRANLELVCTDKKLLQALSWHGVIETYLSTFMRPWLAVAETAKAGGYIYPSFNTVRSTDEYGNRGGVGTRTGRLSSSDPNLQNIPTSVDDSPHAAILVPLRDWIKKYVEFVGMRDYLLPDEGGVFIGRDYSQQELRILAHYEDGILLQMYNDNPRMDIHDAIRNLIIQLLGVDYGRKAIKIADFSIVYGAGGPRLAAQLGVDLETAARIKSAILTAVPGIADINRRMKRMARDEEPLITWGGRQYFCEEPKEVNGKMRSFEYKMLNLLIQGSAADCTKIAMLNMHQNMDLRVSRPVLQVHDELLWCTQPSQVKKEMARMREAMEDVKFDLPMLTDGKVSTKNGSWASMKEVSW